MAIMGTTRPDPAHLQQLYMQGMQAHGAGDLARAEALYRQVLAAVPHQPETLYQMGRLKTQEGALREALGFYEKALAAAPQAFEIWQAVVETMAALGMKKHLKRLLRRARGQGFTPDQLSRLEALAEKGRDQVATSLGTAPKAEVDRAVALLRSGAIDAAEREVARLLEAHPDVAFLHNLAGIIAAEKGDPETARRHFAEAVRRDPLFPDARNNLGKILLDLGETAEALNEIEAALELVPDHRGARLNKAMALLKLERPVAALEILREVAKEAPDNPDILALLAMAKSDAKLHEAALRDLQRLKKMAPAKYLGHVDEAKALEELGREEEARALLETRLAEGGPDARQVKLALAQLLMRLGDFDAAERLHEELLDETPHATGIYLQMGRARKWRPDDPFLARMRVLWEDDTLADSDRIHLGFALGKAMEDIGEYEAAIRYLDVANALHRKSFHYSTEEAAADFRRLREALSPEFFEKFRDAGIDDETPIFIVGLPRSGSTLTEQIISAHPDVGGAGEIGSFSQPAHFLMQKPDGRFRTAREVAPKDIRALAERCIATLRKEFPDLPRVSDKTLHTFVYLGLVHVALPKAKVVHVHRDPIDNCLSIYKNQFADTAHRYAYDQRELGEYWVMYREHMDYWERLFPGRAIDLDYDRLVADPETEARALIEALGLSWDPACLDVTANRRKVKTLSVYQARQPIYRSSSKKWRRYGKGLLPMIEALEKGGVLPEDDLAALEELRREG